MPLGFKVSGIEYLRYQNSFAIFFYIHEEIKPSPCLIMILHHWQLKTQVMHIRNSVVSSTLRIKREHKKIVLKIFQEIPQPDKKLSRIRRLDTF